MKGLIISPDSDFFEVKDLDKFITDFVKEAPLKDLIENQQFYLHIHDTLEQMVRDGKLEKIGHGTEEDECFEQLRKTIKYLKKALKSQSKEKPISVSDET